MLVFVQTVPDRSREINALRKHKKIDKMKVTQKRDNVSRVQKTDNNVLMNDLV